MKKLFKFFFYSFLVLSIALAGGIYYLTIKFDQEYLIGLIEETVENAFPKTDISIKSIDYKLGKSISFQIKGLYLVEKNSKAKLVNFDDLKVDIPIMAILEQGGVINISSQSPNIFVQKNGDDINWLRILPESTKVKENKDNKELDLEIPEVIEKSKVNLKIKNLGLDLIMDGKESKLKVSKFFLKDIKLNAPMGFEVATSINHQIDEKMKLATNIETKGTIDLPGLIEKSQIDLQADFNVTKSLLTDIPFKIPNVKGKLKVSGKGKDFDIDLNTNMDQLTSIDSKLKILKENVYLENLNVTVALGELNNYVGAYIKSSLKDLKLSGSSLNLNLKGNITLSENGPDVNVLVNTKLDDLLKFKSKLKINKTIVEVKDLDSSIALGKIKKYLGKKIKSSLNILNFNSSTLMLNGQVNMGLEPFSFKPTLNFKNTNSIIVKPTSDITTKVRFNGSFNNNNLNLHSTNDVFGGKVISTVTTYIDPMNLKTDVKQLSPINLKMNLANFNVSKKLIQKTLYSKSKKKGTQKQVVDNSPGKKIFLPPVNIDISGNNIFIDKKKLALKGKVSAGGKKIKSDGLRLTYGKGYLSTKFDATINSTKNINSNLYLFFKNVRVDAFNAFFPPYIKDVKGRFKGKVTGSVSLGKKVNYNLNALLKGYGGELKNFNVAKIVGPMLKDIKLLKGKIPKKYNVSDRFESIDINVHATDKTVKVNKFSLVGNRKESRATTKGSVSMAEGNSSLVGTLYIKKIARDLRRYTRKKSLPYRLSGKGFGLKPDLNYTLNKLGKSVINAQKKKLQTALKKEKKKLKKNIKKEISRGKKKLSKNIKREKKKVRKKIDAEKKKAKKKASDFLKKKIKGIKL